jgi:hypothetical protein
MSFGVVESEDGGEGGKDGEDEEQGQQTAAMGWVWCGECFLHVPHFTAWGLEGDQRGCGLHTWRSKEGRLGDMTNSQLIFTAHCGA